MSRLARDYSWHLLALTLVVGVLGLLAPLAWRKTRAPQGRDFQADLPAAEAAVADQTPVELLPQPQVAVLRPPVADQIDLDPSVLEPPSKPAAPPPPLNEPPALAPATTAPAPDPELPAQPPEDLRLSATNNRPSLPETIDASSLPPVVQPLLPESASPDSPLQPLATPGAWPYPAALVEQLTALAEATPAAAPWVVQVRAEIERLAAVAQLDSAAATDPLVQLRKLAEAAKPLAEAQKDEHDRSRILRAGYAIVRRLVIWDQAHTLAARAGSIAVPVVDRQALLASLTKAESMLQATCEAATWRNYLLLDRAREVFASTEHSAADQRQLARDMLHRMRSTQLSYVQDQFLKQPPFDALARQLEAWAAQAPELPRLLTAIERHEQEETSMLARALASEYDALRWSPDEAVRDLAESVNAYYRNANVRVALSGELINRMLPRQTAQVEAVEDTILGAWVSGQSHTNTSLRLVLVPDTHRWNLGLEAVGQVASDTASSKGPATFYQNGLSFFRARKRLTVDRRGIRLFNAEAEANANNELNDFETDFDGIPLLGGLARAIARNQYDQSQPAAKVEVEGKIIIRAASQLDREVAEKLEKAKQDFQGKIAAPLRQLNVEPTAVDLETTEHRLIARYRLAARDQVSAHTPRPQAPGDSLLSVQVHESAFNNVLSKLQLAGRRVELRELFKEMTTRFRREPVPVPEDLPEEVYVTFADEDPVRLDCQDGRVRLTIRLKELSQGRNHWTNFTVRGYYAPSADQLDANLERDGTIELIGDGRQLPIGQQVALRGIFARVLSRNRKLNVINKQIAEAPELRDQQVTQFVIHDGWIGVALGPKAPGRQAAMQPRPDLSDGAE